MRYNVWMFAAVWGSLFSALQLFPQLELVRILVFLGSFILTGVVADLLVKLITNLLPRKLLPDLHNKAVIITGCSSGFGLSLAKKLDALGVTVYAGVRYPVCPGALELKETCSSNLHVIVLDVTKDQDVKDAAHYVNKTIGHKAFWAVINNAGVAYASPTEWSPDSDFQTTWETNAMGSVRMTKAFLPLLRQSKGRLVFVNSLGGVTGIPVAVSYTMSKFALTGFAEILRRELWRSPVSIHSIHPYFYKTNITDLQKIIEDVNKKWNNISDEVRNSYGEDFFEDFKKSIQKIGMHLSYENIDSAVEDIIDATVGATPKFCYVPDWKPKLFYWGIKNLPNSIVDWICIHLIDQA